jgi:hypothetical protein
VSSGFHLDTSHFTSAAHMQRQLERAIFATVKYWDGPIETHMKHNAPWTDRTTNARNGLFAVAKKLAKGVYAIILGHSVDYGIYLEEKNNGKYAIIRPTMAEYSPRVIGTLTKILDRL